MKKGKMLVAAFLVPVLVMLSFMAACTQTSPSPAPAPAPTTAPSAQPVVIKVALFLPIDNADMVGYQQFEKTVKEQSKGLITLKYVGSTEVIPRPELPMAVIKGVVDMIVSPASEYESLVPETAAQKISQISPAEERARGFYDVMIEAHKKQGMYYLARSDVDTMHLYLRNKRVATPKDLVGLKMRCPPLTQPFVVALGASPVTIPPPDLYLALERGVVDGFSWSSIGVIDFGWQEVTKYKITHPVLTSDTNIIMNLNSWNALPKSSQDLMTSILTQFDKEVKGVYEEMAVKEEKAMVAAGMEMISFTDAEAKAYQKLAADAWWNKVKTLVSPEMFTKLQQTLTK